MFAALGKQTIAAAGTPQQVYAGQGGGGGTALNLKGSTVFVRALKANAGTIYVGVAGMDKTTGAGVIDELVPGAAQPYSVQTGNSLNVEELWGDGDDTGDGFLVTVLG